MRSIIVIAHNLRSCHNVGSLLRTAEGLGADKVILTGYTPYPLEPNDTRMPHIANKLHKQIRKTALDAEELVSWEHADAVEPILERLKSEGYFVAAIEQSADSISLPDFAPPEKIVLIVGREVEGVEPEVLKACNAIVEIPMYGKKESFNVVQAAAMSLYHVRFFRTTIKL